MKEHWEASALPEGTGVYHCGERVDCEELFLWTADLPVWAEGQEMVTVLMRGEDYDRMALAWAREVCSPKETGHCYDSARLQGIEWRNGDRIPIPLRILGIETWNDGENPEWYVMFLAGHENVKREEYWRKKRKDNPV